MYSQNDEEKIILDYFGERVSKFIDIGAYDGRQFSNTLALLERGWSGVMVEPSASAFTGLIHNTLPHADRVTLVNAALHLTGGPITFYDSMGDAVSTFSEAHREKWKSAAPMRSIITNAIPVSWLWSRFPGADFINLDVEAYNWELFQTIPFPSVQMVCVEQDKRGDDMTVLAERHGLTLRHETAENLIFSR
jgi:FkbM family methyltransferase